MQISRFWSTDRTYCLLSGTLLLITACDFIGDSNARLSEDVFGSIEPDTVEWTDLIPETDLSALLNPSEYLLNIEEGSDEDNKLFEQLKSGSLSEPQDRYQQALLSTDVRNEFNGKEIRIAGFLVPLEHNHAELVTQAFLVPYFGACIHVPPPPPNQIVLLNAEDGIILDDMYSPYWVSGKMSTTLYENEIGTSAYHLNVTSYELYTE